MKFSVKAKIPLNHQCHVKYPLSLSMSKNFQHYAEYVFQAPASKHLSPPTCLRRGQVVVHHNGKEIAGVMMKTIMQDVIGMEVPAANHMENLIGILFVMIVNA